MTYFFNKKNLDGITSDTDGLTINTSRLKEKTVFTTVSGNTGAVTVKIQGSANGTNWADIDSTVYTATNTTTEKNVNKCMPKMRTITASQSNSTVSTIITGQE